MANVCCVPPPPTSVQHAAESEGGFIHQTEDRESDERAGLAADVM